MASTNTTTSALTGTAGAAGAGADAPGVAGTFVLVASMANRASAAYASGCSRRPSRRARVNSASVARCSTDANGAQSFGANPALTITRPSASVRVRTNRRARNRT